MIFFCSSRPNASGFIIYIAPHLPRHWRLEIVIRFVDLTYDCTRTTKIYHRLGGGRLKDERGNTFSHSRKSKFESVDHLVQVRNLNSIFTIEPASRTCCVGWPPPLSTINHLWRKYAYHAHSYNDKLMWEEATSAMWSMLLFFDLPDPIWRTKCTTRIEHRGLSHHFRCIFHHTPANSLQRVVSLACNWPQVLAWAMFSLDGGRTFLTCAICESD